MARILFLTQTYPRYPEDTAGPFIRELARALVRGGDRVVVLAPHARGLGPAWDDDGVAVRTFRYAPVAAERIGYSRSLERDERIRGAALAATPLYLAAATAAVRRTVRAEGIEIVQGHWLVPNGPAAVLGAGRARVGFGLHGSDVFLAERPGIRRIARWCLARGAFLTGCSPELVERVLRLGSAASVIGSGAFAVIPYGVDSAAFAPPAEGGSEGADAWRQELGISRDAVLLLGVGRMATKKGFHVLIEALGLLRARRPRLEGELAVVLAGGGDREPELRRRAEALELPIRFPGLVERDTLPDLYRAADLFALPAVHDEKGNVDGLPNVILEAMASGLPVVASGISGIPLAVEDGVHGRLVPEGDAAAVAAALEELLEDRGLRLRLGRAARERVERDLTWDAVAERYRDAYALGGAPGAAAESAVS